MNVLEKLARDAQNISESTGIEFGIVMSLDGDIIAIVSDSDIPVFAYYEDFYSAYTTNSGIEESTQESAIDAMLDEIKMM